MSLCRQFLGFVFHEVRIPLNSLLLGINVVSENADDPTAVREALGMMEVGKTTTSLL